jgi:hypothetical protein
MKTDRFIQKGLFSLLIGKQSFFIVHRIFDGKQAILLNSPDLSIDRRALLLFPIHDKSILWQTTAWDIAVLYKCDSVDETDAKKGRNIALASRKVK